MPVSTSLEKINPERLKAQREMDKDDEEEELLLRLETRRRTCIPGHLRRLEKEHLLNPKP